MAVDSLQVQIHYHEPNNFYSLTIYISSAKTIVDCLMAHNNLEI